MKEVFVDKLKEFDFLVGDKENKINKLNQDISSKNEEIKNLEKKLTELNKFSIPNNTPDVILPKYAAIFVAK